MIEERRLGENPMLETRAESYESVDIKLRQNQIKEILEDSKTPMSDKEIAVEMSKRSYIPTSERNFSSPRITELLQTGELEVIGKKKCQYSNKKVRVVALRKNN